MAVLPSILLLLASANFPAQPMLHDGVTGTGFEVSKTLDGTSYRCLGAGGRKVFTFKIYAVAFCLEAHSANELDRWIRGAHPNEGVGELSRSLANDQRFFDALIAAPGSKLAILRFLRDVPHARLAKSIRGSLRSVLPEAEADRVTQALEHDIAKGQVATMRSRGTDLVVELGSVARTIENAPLVTERIWHLWLGADSATPNLKESIASNLAQRR
jgi:hypothetical protein